MKQTVTERQLKEVSKRIAGYKDELAIASEQLAHLENEAENARMRSLVSETAIADLERRKTEQQVQSMVRHYRFITSELEMLEERQDELLDKMTKTGSE